MEKDDFLRDLIQKSPLDSPSDDFVDRVMASLQLAPELAPEKKPFFLQIKNSLPYIILALVVFIVFATSDLPFLNWLPWKENLVDNLVPYFGSIVSGLKVVFSSKYVSFGLLISVSAGLLFLVDRLLSRRSIA